MLRTGRLEAIEWGDAWTWTETGLTAWAGKAGVREWMDAWTWTACAGIPRRVLGGRERAWTWTGGLDEYLTRSNDCLKNF